MKPPPWLNDPCALVLVDWSWWLNRALHGEHGVEGMLSLVVGWLTQMLAYEPAHLALALDSPGETWRHRKRHPTDPDWKYKGDRPPKPPEFGPISRVATRIAELHAIPCLWADGYEADDVIATACAKARAAGYRVWIASADKDLHHLVEDDPRSGLIVGMWNPFERDAWDARDVARVREAYSVDPEQIPDWLAICGDDSDGVPGVEHGLGVKRAAAILAAHRTLAEALAAPLWSTTKVEEIQREIKALGHAAKVATVGLDPKGAADAKVRRAQLMLDKRVEGWRLTLVAHRALAEFSRELTALDCDAPVDVPWEEIPVGGFEVEELRALYTKHGFTRKAAEVPSVSKRAPWRIPWTAEDSGTYGVEPARAPAPRKEGKRNVDRKMDGHGPGRRRALSGERGATGQIQHNVGARAEDGSPVQDEAGRAERSRGVPVAHLGNREDPAPAPPPCTAARDIAHELNEDIDEPAEEPREVLDEQIVRGRIARTYTAVGRKCIVDDLLGGTKYALSADVRDRLIAEVRSAGEVAA